MELKDIESRVLSSYRINPYGPTVIESEDGALCPYCGEKLKTSFNKEKNVWETRYCDKCTDKVDAEMTFNRLLIDYENQIRELQSKKNDIEILLKSHIFDKGMMTEKIISTMEEDAKSLREELDARNHLFN